MSTGKKAEIDYTLYLVTGRELLPPGKSYLESLEEALQGGVTVVQVREKKADTAEFLEIAQDTIALCAKYNVPVLINDRIDIALASGAAGVHLGQTDMPIAVARTLLPPHMVLGLSCTTPAQVHAAVAAKVDYVGLGAVYDTATKSLDPDRVRGVAGVREKVALLEGTEVKSVAIGGIKASNALRVLHGSMSPTGHGLDGLAVVSEIVASRDPRAASQQLVQILRAWKSVPYGPTSFSYITDKHTLDDILDRACGLLDAVRQTKPLVHQLTNNVVKTQSANVTLALGGSPIMAESPEEQADLARVPGGLLVNFGTISAMRGMLAAGQHANLNRKPVVYDPVGVGATAFRRASSKQLLDAWQPAVIKGNAAEIGALANSDEVKAQGVDSVGSGFKDPAAVVRLLARQERCIVVLSGPTDYISDGSTVLRLSNGHALLGQITGAGCILGTALATFCGAASILAEQKPSDEAAGTLAQGDMLVAAIAGTLALTVAAEKAAERSEVRGPGTFLPVLIDELSLLTSEEMRKRAKAELDGA